MFKLYIAAVFSRFVFISETEQSNPFACLPLETPNNNNNNNNKLSLLYYNKQYNRLNINIKILTYKTVTQPTKLNNK